MEGMLTWSLLIVAIAGLVCSTGFLVLIVYAAMRFRRRAPLPRAAEQPGVTLLKPLCGLEPRIEENLASFFDQDYAKFEIIFGTRDEKDPALEVVRAIQKRFPRVRVKFAYSGEPDRPNAKVCSLEKMYALAEYNYLIISDSDVRVTREYIREVVRPLLEPGVGMVSCIYRGVPTGGLWSRLEALGMSVEMTSGVLVAELLEGMTFALGPTMAIRRDALEAVGGIAPLAEYCADDYVLGNEVHLSGRKVVLPTYVVDHVVLGRSFKASMLHQLRWMKSTRFSRPSGHLGTLLTFAMPVGILGAVAGFAGGKPMLGASLLAWALANRIIMSIAAGYGVVGDRRALHDCWLYPLRDLTGFLVWCGSYFGETVDWRGEKYRLTAKGRMVRIGGVLAPEESASVTVNDLS
jgi:ceramide glucosyltransferase